MPLRCLRSGSPKELFFGRLKTKLFINKGVYVTHLEYQALSDLVRAQGDMTILLIQKVDLLKGFVDKLATATLSFHEMPEHFFKENLKGCDETQEAQTKTKV